MKFTFEDKTKLFFPLTAAVLISLLAVFYYSTRKVKQSNDLVDHTQEVLHMSDKVLLDLLNIENGIRGYILTGNQFFLEPYYLAKDKINSDLSVLQAITTENPGHQARIDTLKRIVAEKLVLTKKLVDGWNQNLFNETEKSGNLENGKVLNDQIRRLIAVINFDEFNLLKIRKIDNERSSKNSMIVFLFLLLVIGAIFLFIIVIAKNQKNRTNDLKVFTSTQKLLSNYSLSLIEASLDPLVTINAEGKITDMNEALVKITGISREILTGSDFIDYFTEPQIARDVYLAVFDKGSIADLPLTFRDIRGKLTDVLFNGSVYKGDRGNVLGAVVVARDMAQQKWALGLQKANKELAFQNDEKEKRAQELSIANEELAYQNEEKEKRAEELFIANQELIFQTGEKEKRAAELVIADLELEFQNKEKEKREIVNKELEALTYSAQLASQYARSLIEASRDPLFTINLEGKITDMNNASENITGLMRDKLIDTDFFDYFTEPEKARVVYQDVFAKGFVKDYPLTIMDGKLTDVLFNGSVYTDSKGKVLGVVVVARDITEQKRIEKELIEAKVFAELATLLAEEAKIKAENSMRTAENAVKAKQQFLSNMSHEIRTPMNAIIGFTKVILKTELSAKQREYLTAIKMSGDSLIVLINDILDLAKVDAGKMVFELVPFKMALSISAMLHLFEPKIEEKNLKLFKEYDHRIPEVLIGDPVRLHQIILNLVSNAVKFTNKGRITVSVRLLSESDEKVTIEFSVEDTGIGIPVNKIGRIFENFQQASSGTSRLYGGTGLGLAIVKQLVEPQGGIINVKSKIDEGSTFSFTLTFLKTTAVPEAENVIEEFDTDIKDIKVLVVEDITLNQLLMKTLLDEFGFERDIASNGKIAIEKLQTKSYDVILMDLQMPEMNGFEATEYIRHTMHSKIPIIALTADVTTVDLAKCKEVGMNDYLAKPIDERLLFNKIVSLVRKPNQFKSLGDEPDKIVEYRRSKCIDLEYLIHRTKSNPVLMMEMISAYLEQTPRLIGSMKQSFKDRDWNILYASVHKMIPSFSIMGMSIDFENMAKKVQEYASTQKQADGINDLVLQLGNVCTLACEELQIEFNRLKKQTHV
ncbi:MAG: ATP-binding protein [Mariniphaga sp.]